MTRRACGAAVAALAALAVAAPATYAAGQPLNAYRVKADPETLEALAQAGYDVGEGRRINGKVEIYATAGQARSLRRDGLAAKVVGGARKAQGFRGRSPGGRRQRV